MEESQNEAEKRGRAMTHTYSDCFFCGGCVEERIVQREIWWENRLFIVEKVPAGVCKQCGETVVLPEVARKIDGLLKSPGSPDKVITVPVYSLA